MRVSASGARHKDWDWIAPAAAALGLVVLTLLFAFELKGFRQAIIGWAERDLKSRTQLAAETLAEPLRTSDFRRIHACGNEFTQAGLRLTVLSKQGGTFYDTLRKDAEVSESIVVDRPCGEFVVRLALPLKRVLEPVERARRSLILAGCLGGSAVLIVFFFTFRQRVRLRELARVERFRREFIADVSHEIKTPLTGILGSVDLMDDEVGRLQGDATLLRRLLGLVKDESKRLNALVQSILDLARLEQKGQLLDLTETNVATLVAEEIVRLKPQAAERGVQLVTELTDLSSVTAALDVRLVSVAVSNLVLNAVRHSGAQEVTIAGRRVKQGFEISVEDRGIGIPPEHRAQIFERFHRVDASRAAANGGAGLGLAIVRGIARRHGGEARFEPVEPHGSRFVLFFPRASLKDAARQTFSAT